jgi:hypothetical protein
MITAEQIPDEVVEAAHEANAACDGKDWMRVAIAAALNAWEGAETRLEDWHTPPETVLILPLQKEGE